MTARHFHWIVLGIAVATLGAALLLPGRSGASSLLTVTLHPTATAFAPGTDAAVLVRAEGDAPELADYGFSVENGILVGAVVPNATAPGVAEGRVVVRRETPGSATVHVKVGGVDAAVTDVVFANGAASTQAASPVTIKVTLDAAVHASARTWRFEVVNGAGQVLAAVSAGTSGDAPTGIVTTDPLPAAAYTVRQVLGNDTKLGCTTGAFYQVVSPAGGSMSVVVPGSAVATFVIKPCPGAPTDLGVSRPDDPVATPPAPIDEVRGVREEGPPQAPSAGTGFAPDERGFPVILFAFGGALILLSGAGLLALATQQPRRR